MEKPQKEKRSQYSGFSAYAGLSVQMGIIIFLGTFGGLKLDQSLGSSPAFTIVLALASIALAMYVLIIKTQQKK